MIICAGTILTVDAARRILTDGALMVQGDRIVAAGKRAAMEAQYPAEEVADCGDALIMPGLIDTHVHLAQAMIRGCADDMELLRWLTERVWVLQGNYTAGDGRASARLCMAEMLLSGTTTFLESLLAERYGIDGIAEAVIESGMRGCLGKVVMDVASYADSPLPMYHGMIEDGPTSVARTMEAFRRWNGRGDGRLQIWFGARTPGGCTRGLYREISDLARHHGLGITVHLAEVRADIAFLQARYGQGPVAFAQDVGLLGKRTVLAHSVWMTEAELPALAASGASVSHNPSSNAKLASGTAPIPAMLAAGVNVALGCDGGPSNNNYDLIREMKLAASIHKGMTLDPTVVPAEKVLEMATIDGARALGLAHEIGSLEAGKKADLIVVDMHRPHLTPSFNPVSTIVYAAMGSDVAHVMIDGRWVVRDRCLLTMDEHEVIVAARRHVGDLLTRSGIDLRPRWPVES